jgi:hypothetical protein
MTTNSNTCRCGTCGRTNNRELILSEQDYTPGPFFDDEHPTYPGDKICADCLNTVNEINEIFEDEEDGTESAFEYDNK